MFHLQPHLTHLLCYNDARVNLSEVVHQTFLSGWVWVCKSVHRCSFLVRNERAALKSGTKAICEQAGSLQLCSSPQAGLKAPAAKGNIPGLLPSSANSSVPQHLCHVWVRACGFQGGRWNIYGRGESQRQIIFFTMLWEPSPMRPFRSHVLWLPYVAKPFYHVKHELSHKKPQRWPTHRFIQSPGRRNSAGDSFRGFK